MPILVRPVREQLEHDRIIRLLEAQWRPKYKVDMNPGDERNAAVKVGASTLYPDLVLTEEGGRKPHALVEVETGESVNHLEAMAQWANLAKSKSSLYLFVPAGSVESARRLASDHRIELAELWTYLVIGDQVRFTSVLQGDGEELLLSDRLISNPPRQPVMEAPSLAAPPPGAAKPEAPKAAAPKPTAPKRAAPKPVAAKPVAPRPAAVAKPAVPAVKATPSPKVAAAKPAAPAPRTVEPRRKVQPAVVAKRPATNGHSPVKARPPVRPPARPVARPPAARPSAAPRPSTRAAAVARPANGRTTTKRTPARPAPAKRPASKSGRTQKRR